MAAPSIYAAISAMTADLAAEGIPKRSANEIDQYRYRSIDDVLNRLAPLFAKHRICALPRVLERQVVERQDRAGLLIGVALRVAYSLVSAADGSTHVVEAYGEALDSGDKATSKAMSSAYKSAMIQAFCIPLGEGEDADAASHKLSAKTHVPQPVQGWDQWWRDITDIVEVCESEEAVDSVQERNRELLKAISRERPELYERLGAAFTSRRHNLRARSAQQLPIPKSSKRRSKVRGDLQMAET
jgi:hypothetical protein